MITSAYAYESSIVENIVDGLGLEDLLPRTPDSFFKELKENNAESMQSKFMIDNTGRLSDIGELNISFKNDCGQALKYKIFIDDICTKEVPVQETKNECKLNKTIDKEQCQKVITTKGTKTENYECKKEVTEIPMGNKDYSIKITDWTLENCDNSFGYKIDWIPTLKIGNKKYTYEDWAWLNASYHSRYFINCSNIPKGRIIAVNGTNGVKLNGTSAQYIWTRCEPDLYLYYNDYNQWTIANDTKITSFDVELGNRTSNTGHKVYTSSFTSVYHLSNNTDSSQVGNDLSGTTTKTRAIIGKGVLLTGSNNLIDSSYSSNVSNKFTQICWAKRTSDNKYITALSNSGNFNEYWISILIAETKYQNFDLNGNVEVSRIKSGTSTLDTWAFIAQTFDGSTYSFYYNNSLIGTNSSTDTWSGYDYMGIGVLPGVSSGYTGTLDECWFLSADLNTSIMDTLFKNQKYTVGYGSAERSELIPDTSLPILTLTSIAADINSPYENTDITPDVIFITSENAWCRISDSDQSYDGMTSAKDCSTGQGTTSHTCTSPTLIVGTNDTIHLACKDTVGNNHSIATNSDYFYHVQCSQNSECNANQFCNSTRFCQSDLAHNETCTGTYVATDAERNGACSDGDCQDGGTKCNRKPTKGTITNENDISSTNSTVLEYQACTDLDGDGIKYGLKVGTATGGIQVGNFTNINALLYNVSGFNSLTTYYFSYDCFDSNSYYSGSWSTEDTFNRVNAQPIISLTNITNTNVYNDTAINCSIEGYQDSDPAITQAAEYYFKWYKNTVLQFTNKTSQHYATSSIDKIIGDNISCGGIAFDTISNSTEKFDYEIVLNKPPFLNITFPNSTGIHFNSNINIAFTASDQNLTNCWWTKNSGVTNNSITCNTNITGQTWVEGNNSVTIYANDSYGDFSSNSTWFIKDTTKPILSLKKPLNTSSHFNVSTIHFDMEMNDTYLFGYNITCRNSTGKTEYTVQNTSISLTGIKVNKTTQFTKIGRKRCNITVVDSHTNNIFNPEIKQYEAGLILGKDEIIINDELKVIADDMYIEKKIDRISPIIKVKPKKNWLGQIQKKPIEIKWEIEYTGNTYEIDSDYHDHLVIIPEGKELKDGYWIDAENNLNEKVNYKIKKNSIEFSTLVDYDKLEQNNFEFKTESLGGLNHEINSINFLINASQDITLAGYNLETNHSVTINASVTNSLGTTAYSNNATIRVELPCTTNIITIKAPGYMNTQTTTTTNCISPDINTTFWQAVLTSSVKNVASGSLITGAKVNLTTQGRSYSYSTNPRSLYVNNGSYYFNVTHPNYIQNNTASTITFKQSKTQTIYMVPNYTINFKREETGANFSFLEEMNQTACVNGTYNQTAYAEQEDPTTYACEGTFNGNHTCIDGLDGIYSTYSMSGSSMNATTYINYTKPTTAKNISKLRLKKDDLSYKNYTMTSYINCWNQNKLQFKTVSNISKNKLVLYCYSGASWQLMEDISNGGLLYDEQMLWAYNENVTNSTTCQNNQSVTIDVEVFCDDKTISSTLNNTYKTLSSIDCQYRYWLLKVVYSSENYFRTIIPDPNNFTANVFLLDLNYDQAVQIIFEVIDLSNDYSDGRIRLKKVVNGVKYIVTEQYLDVNGKVTFWLDRDEVYEIYSVDNNGKEIYEGDLIADAAGTKQLIIPRIQLSYDGVSMAHSINWRYTVNKTAGTAYLLLVDRTADGYDNFTWDITNVFTGSNVFHYSSASGLNDTVYAFNLNESVSYRSKLVITHPDFTNQIIETRPLWIASETEFPGWAGETGNPDQTDYTDLIKMIVAIFFPILIYTIFHKKTAEIGMTITIILMMVFNSKGWYTYMEGRYHGGADTITVIILLLALLTFWMWIKKSRKVE